MKTTFRLIGSKIYDLTGGKVAEFDLLTDCYNYFIEGYEVTEPTNIGNYTMYLSDSHMGSVGSEGLEKFIKNKTRDNTFWDIGANIGYYTLECSPTAQKVISFEPEKHTYDILKKNIIINGLNNVETKRLAVSNENGRTELYWDPATGGSHSLSESDNLKREPQSVQTRTIDSLIEDFGKPDFVKVDVEGAELKVLKGAEELMRENKTEWLIEVHSSRVRGYFDRINQHGGDADSLYTLLANNGYDILGYDTTREKTFEFDVSGSQIPKYWYATKPK